MTRAMKGRNMLMKSTIIAMVLKMMALIEMFLIRLQKRTKKGADIDAKM